MRKKIVLTGIKPTGSPHLGNYLGAIKPALALAQDEQYQSMYFIADYHALTAIKEPKYFRNLCYEVAATWIALGLNTDKVIFYRQSDIPEIFELTWILACLTPKGLMNRAHAYKAAVAQNLESKTSDIDSGINMGLYNYPILMAADILLFETDFVPVGKDQIQHIEITNDIAQSFNTTYREIFKLPKYLIQEETASLPGLDGRKMSKSYDNTIPLFVSPEQLRKRIFRIKTDSTPPEEPKDPTTSTLFLIYKEFASPEQEESMRKQYLKGIAWADVKQELFEMLNSFLGKYREVYNQMMADQQKLDTLLKEGGQKARSLAIPLMEKVRKAIGRL
ncbi:MAG: Tryptophanyl-tRNA synthetase [Candidatus Jettenia ecosi]|uniref:Tryptophan--tRNA ligase n=1 Tax=Candidatus Jettenia ecosi TaxID=2494326 RepID=A0A533Q7Z8_9BACT|nr:MAG: Tryptophanyl-tRNA synthetase [Candidatus Jettenia ecosi]